MEDQSPSAANKPSEILVAVLTGVLVFFLPLKFTSPVILEVMHQMPGKLDEWIFFSWPNVFCYLVVASLGMILLATNPGLVKQSFSSSSSVMAWLWFLGQMMALAFSIHMGGSLDVIVLWIMSVLIFYVGAWTGGNNLARHVVLSALSISSLLVFASALSQHFGGLESTREYLDEFLQEHQMAPEMAEKLKEKVKSNRVFGTMTYPNSLGAYILIALPVFLACLWELRLAAILRFLMALFFLMVSFYVLSLTGSKGSFVALGGAVGIGILLLPMKVRWKSFLVVGGIAGLAIFYVLAYGIHSLSSGKITFSARMDYWMAAWQVGWDHLWFGTGPGTFSISYFNYKAPGAEETKFVHNNYLQMWSDSGLIGMATFCAWWFLPLIRKAKGIWLQKAIRPEFFLWLALVASAIHWTVDFDIYIPALFLLSSLLLGMLVFWKNAEESSVPKSAPPETLMGGEVLPLTQSSSEESSGNPEKGPVEVLPVQSRWNSGVTLSMVLLSALVVLACIISWQRLRANQLMMEFKRNYAEKPEQSIQWLGAARQVYPWESLYPYMMARAYFNMGDFTNAQHYVQVALMQDSRRGIYHFLAAQIEARQTGPSDPALQHMSNAVSLYPSNIQYMEALVAGLYIAGKPEAVELEKELLELRARADLRQSQLR